MPQNRKRNSMSSKWSNQVKASSAVQFSPERQYSSKSLQQNQFVQARLWLRGFLLVQMILKLCTKPLVKCLMYPSSVLRNTVCRLWITRRRRVQGGSFPSQLTLLSSQGCVCNMFSKCLMNTPPSYLKSVRESTLSVEGEIVVSVVCRMFQFHFLQLFIIFIFPIVQMFLGQTSFSVTDFSDMCFRGVTIHRSGSI